MIDLPSTLLQYATEGRGTSCGYRYFAVGSNVCINCGGGAGAESLADQIAAALNAAYQIGYADRVVTEFNNSQPFKPQSKTSLL